MYTPKQLDDLEHTYHEAVSEGRETVEITVAGLDLFLEMAYAYYRLKKEIEGEHNDTDFQDDYDADPED